MGVVIELQSSKSARMESHGVDFTGVSLERKDCPQGIVGGIGLDNDWSVWNPMRENRSGGKGRLERFKGFSSVVSEVPFDSFASESSERNDDIGVIGDEATIEIGEAKEGLDVLHLSGFRPILDGLDLSGIHLQAIFGQDKAEVFDSVGGEVTFVWTSIETILPETPEYFTDVLLVFCGIVGVHENVV